MTSSQSNPPRPVSHHRRNLLAVLIAFAAVSILYFNFEATPAGGSFAEDVDLDKVTQDVSVPTGETDSTNATGSNADDAKTSNALHGRSALLMHLMLIERGIKKLQNVDDYTATFYKRELVGGELSEAQVMHLKLRHEPFSVYMKWLMGDKGRELLYVDGQHNGKMLVRLGGVKKLIPTLKLDPAGSRALKESRYPVTDIGLLNLAKKIAAYRRKDVERTNPPRCRMFDGQTFNDRKCYCFVIEYDNPQQSRMYRKSVVFIDKQWCVPLCVQNFGWPDSNTDVTGATLDKKTLVEDYRYRDIHLDKKLADRDFDRSNREYRLR